MSAHAETDAADALTRVLRTNFPGHHPQDYPAAAQMLMANFHGRHAELKDIYRVASDITGDWTVKVTKAQREELRRVVLKYELLCGPGVK